MNVSQLATAVGQRLGIDTSVATSRDGAAVRSFMSIRHDQLYRSFLWRDSIVEFEIPIDPSTPYIPTANYMPTKGRVILPSIFQHVLGARLGWRSLDVQRPMLFYRADYARFMKSGYTADFTLLSSCVWEFDVAQTLSLVNANPTDDNVIVTVDTVASDEVSINRSTVATLTTGASIGTTDRVDNFIKPATQGSVSFGILTTSQTQITFSGSSFVNLNGTYTIDPATGIYSNGSCFIYPPGTPPPQAVQLPPSPAYCITTAPNPPQVQIIYYYSSTLINPSWTYFGALSGSPATVAVTSVSPIITILGSDLSAPKCQRIQLIGKPKTTGQKTCNLHVLGKRVTPPFSAETDTPGINGIEGVLFALAYYDFKSRDEAGGSADAKDALLEAVGPNFLTRGVPGGFLGKLIEEECVQAAYNTRIIPSEGFGGDCYFDEPYGSKYNPYW